MQSPSRFDRKQFLCWSVAAAPAAAFGCSDDAEPGPSGGGAGGAGGSSSNAGTFSSGGAGSGGTFASGGSSGSGTGGAGGATGGGGGAGGGAPAMPDCGTKLKTLITADHGHAFMVTMADVMAGVDKMYDTKGASDHPHWIKLTAADFAKLAAGGTVRKISCNDGHEHEFIVNCLGEAMPMTTGGVAGLCETQRTCGDTMTALCAELPVM